MIYRLLEIGEVIEKTDQVYEILTLGSGKWSNVLPHTVGHQCHAHSYPIRRLINQPKPVELFTIPCGPWVGCTGSVFMDGDQKKVRLQNVFVGGERHVIDFPRRERYDNKHFVLGDDEIIVQGDKFVSHFNDVNECQMSIGMTVKAAIKKHTAIKLILRPVS